MTNQDIENYCLSKTGVVKAYPFDKTTAVYKVGNKMFVLYNEAKEGVSLNLKCDPLYALELRSMYVSVVAGYHMSKKHWNTVICNYELEDKLVIEWIDDSYDLVFTSLSKKLQNEINEKVSRC